VAEALGVGVPGGTAELDTMVTGWSVDSRTVEPGDLFFALRGPLHDGHRYVAEVLGKGAAAAVVEGASDGIGPVLRVADTLRALQELGPRTPDSARWWLLGLGIILAALCLWRRRIGPALVLLVAAFAFLRHQRMEGPCIILICLIGGSVLANAAAHNPFPRHKASFAFALVALLAALVAVRCFDLVTNRIYLSSGDLTLFGTGPSWWLPERATNFILQNHPPANLFSSFNLGSYLVWRLGDRYPDFADGRYIPFGPQLFDEQRTLTCFLEYGVSTVTAHDLLHERDGERWRLRVSSYPKLRLSPDWVVQTLRGLGLDARLEHRPGKMPLVTARKAARSAPQE